MVHRKRRYEGLEILVREECHRALDVVAPGRRHGSLAWSMGDVSIRELSLWEPIGSRAPLSGRAPVFPKRPSTKPVER
jgi:hypothetical protein